MALKNRAKILALDFAMHGPVFLSRPLLGMMKFGFEPASVQSYPRGKRASACISIDYDHFGNVSSNPAKFEPGADMEKLSLNRAGTRLLVALSKKYSMPFTWAICGKTAEADLASFKKITGSGVGHEIGVHTYSHIDVSACSEEELEIEVAKCVEVLSRAGVESGFPKTFIFPWNRTGHFQKLRQLGFKGFRGKQRVIGPPGVSTGGLINIRPTFYAYQGSLEDFRLVKHFIDLCIEKRGVFHMWTHPWSVVLKEDSEKFIEAFLEPIISYLNEKSSAGLISISTMGEISSQAESDCMSGKTGLGARPVPLKAL